MNRWISILLSLLLLSGTLGGCGKKTSSPLPPSPLDEAPSSEESPPAASPQEPAALVELNGQTLSVPSCGLSLLLEGEWTVVPGEMLDQIQQDAAGALGDDRLEQANSSPLFQSSAMAVEVNRSWTLLVSLLPETGLTPLEQAASSAEEMGEILTLLEPVQEVELDGKMGASFTGQYTHPEGGITVWQAVYLVKSQEKMLSFTASCGSLEDLDRMRGMIQGPHSSPPSSIDTEPTGEPDKKEAEDLSDMDLEHMRQYAVSFAEFFDTPFSTVHDLDDREIGLNSLFWLLADQGGSSFETDSHGYSYIPKELLQSYVQEHFGIENYEYPVSESSNFLPQYNGERDAYLFAAARGGPRAIVSIVEEEISGETASYTMRLDFPHMETGEIMETVDMLYRFQILSIGDGCSLRAVSAAIL